MIELLTGAGITLVAYLVGFAMGRRNHKRPPVIAPICHCTHVIGAHEDKTGTCLATIDGPVPEHRYASGNVKTWKQVPCPCQHYTGPELISVFSIQEIAQRQVIREE